MQNRDFKHDPDDPGKKERYQAEALIHKHLPVTAILGIGCYNENVSKIMQKEISIRNLDIQVVVKPKWYFQ